MFKIRNWIKSLFSASTQISRQTLQNLAPEEIRRERIKVEQMETRVTREIEELESQKDQLFAKGVAASSDRQKLQYARKIKELDAQVQARDQQLRLVSKNLRVLNGVSQLKENERVLRDLGMEGLVNKMDLTELQQYVEQATVEGQFQMDKFNEILNALDTAEGVYRTEADEAETLAIFEAMQQADDRKMKSEINQHYDGNLENPQTNSI